MKRKNALKTIRNYIKLITILPILALFVIVYGCTEKNQKYSFEQIGYYKADNKMRAFTFLINTSEKLNKDSIPDELWTTIQNHGNNMMHTQGRQTQSFYYLSREQTPDVTMVNSYDAAINAAYNKKPLAVVSQDISGVNLIKNPED